MFKQLHYFKSWLLLMLCMVVGVGSASAEDKTLTIGFEDASYTDWTLTTIKSQSTNSGVPAHGGNYYGGTDGKESGSVVTKDKITSPKSVTFYVSKESTNNNASSYWQVKVSTDGTNWTQVGDNNAAAVGIAKGKWTEVTQDISSYSNVYVGVFYSGSSAKRCIDDITITYEESDPSDTRADAELSFSSATASATIGQDFTAPTLSAATGFNGTVDYESSNEDVAQIYDQETGELRIVGEGTTTITATFAGNEDFKAGSASYTLTVTDNRIATTISYDNITLDVTEVATLTKLSPVVKDADNNVIAYTYEEFPPTVSFSLESDENGIIGSLDNNSGEITLNATEGTVTLKAYYNLYGVSDTYKPSQCTFTITVEDMNAPGKVNNPYTVAQALAADPANGVYVQGTISAITEVSTQYKNATYTISDGTNEMLIYRGKYLNNTDFTSEDQIQIGDVVKVYGNLAVYQNVNQMAQGNYIVSQTQKELSSITLSGTYTTTFVEGSEFNHEGVVVTATYSDQTTADVTSQAEFSTPDMTQVGEQTVTVSYGGQSTSYNITITEAPTHTATFSVNGTISTEDFKEGAAITFPSVTAPTGYTFMGWTETAISTTQETAPADLTSSATMGNDDVKYYAVFAVGTGSAPSLTKMVAGDNLEDGDKVVIVANDGEDNYALYQETVSNSYVKYYMFDGTYASVIADDKNWVTVVAGSDGTWKFGDDTNGYLYNSGSNNLSVSTVSSTEWTLEDNNDGTFKLYANKRYLSCRSDLTDNKYLYRMSGTSPSGIYSLDIYKVAAGGGYSDYCTTIPTTVAITITAAGAASFSTTFPLDFTGVEGITAYAATFKTDKYVHLEAVTTVPEGEGIIVKGAEGTYDVPIASGTVTLGVENLLKGTATEGRTVTAAEAETGNFYKYVKASGKVGFQKVTDEWTCQQGHAYLELTTEQAREFKGFADEEGGIATGINAIDNGQLTIDNDAPAYNLAGQKVGKGYKGIVVKNGKKYVK